MSLPRDWLAVHIARSAPSHMPIGWFVCGGWAKDPGFGAGHILRVESAIGTEPDSLQRLASDVARKLNGHET